MNQRGATFFFVAVMLGLSLISHVDRERTPQHDEALNRQIQNTSLAEVAAPLRAEAPRVSPEPADPHVANAAVSAEPNTLGLFDRRDVPPPSLNVRAALAVDLESGQELYAREPYQRWPIASLSKLMTALVADEELGSAKIITITDDAMAIEGAAGGFSAGERYTVGDLIKSLFAVSSNRAAVALADAYGSQFFIAKMNARAASLGMIQTNFADPTGLSALNQASPADLLKLVAYLYREHSDIIGIAVKKSVAIRNAGTGAARTLMSINQFSGRPDFLGGKTGYTDEANGNLVSLFSHQGRPIMLIVLGTDDRFKETESFLAWIRLAYTR